VTTFTVWKFEDPEGASQAEEILRAAQSDRLIRIVDHAVVSWPAGAEGPTTKRRRDDVQRGAGWGTLWGLLGGALFAVPVVGGLAGAAIGAISKATEGTGITKDQLERIRTQITEGTSALFVVTDEGDLDRVGERFHGMSWKLIDTNLTDAERRMLFETFGGQ
jgi:uncharacterized membrane protein